MTVYLGQAHAYHRWCRDNGIYTSDMGGAIPFPTPEDLSFYIEWRHAQGDVIQTLRGRLSAISWHFEQHLGRDPAKNDDGSTKHLLADVLRGIARDQKGDTTKLRKPITVPLLKEIIDEFESANPDLNYHDRTAYIALSLAGLYGLLRASEQCTKLTKEFDPRVHLLDSDVEFTYNDKGEPTEATLLIKAAKEDRFRHTQHITVHAVGGKYCPVRWLHRWKKMRRGSSATPFYTLSDGSFITRDRLARRLRRTLNATGRTGTEWSTHSLRSGGAISLAASSNMSSEVLAVAGRWRSDARLLYLKHLPKSVLQNAHQAMSKLTTRNITSSHINTFNSRFSN